MNITARIVPGRPTGQPASMLAPDEQAPARASADGRTAMRTGTGIILVTTGATLLFALTGGSPHWPNLHVSA